MTEHQYTQQPQKTDNTSQKQTIPQKQISISHPAAIIQRARINPKSLTHADVMQLQRTIGNRAVGKLLTEISLIPQKTKQAQPIQMQTISKEEEEPPLQGKMVGTVQRQKIPEEEEPLQAKRENNTGMPDNLKASVESLSRIDMSDVRVHYNSSEPAEVGALAYTQGTDIHVAHGQEKYLPHEAWHVVQQVQGRVKPTLQMKGVAVNDNTGLEREADEMGRKTFEDNKTLPKIEQIYTVGNLEGLYKQGIVVNNRSYLTNQNNAVVQYMMAQGGSMQGEHIFNAVGNMVLDMVELLNVEVQSITNAEKQAFVISEISFLRTMAGQVIDKRDNENFRSADKGDPANSERYSSFKESIIEAIKNILTGEPGKHTLGYIKFNRLYDQMDFYVVDTIARESRFKSLNPAKQRNFNLWFDSTLGDMHYILKLLRDIALDINRYRNVV